MGLVRLQSSHLQCIYMLTLISCSPFRSIRSQFSLFLCFFSNHIVMDDEGRPPLMTMKGRGRIVPSLLQAGHSFLVSRFRAFCRSKIETLHAPPIDGVLGVRPCESYSCPPKTDGSIKPTLKVVFSKQHGGNTVPAHSDELFKYVTTYECIVTIVQLELFPYVVLSLPSSLCCVWSQVNTTHFSGLSFTDIMVFGFYVCRNENFYFTDLTMRKIIACTFTIQDVFYFFIYRYIY